MFILTGMKDLLLQKKDVQNPMRRGVPRAPRVQGRKNLDIRKRNRLTTA
jgi:hypothetical protein